SAACAGRWGAVCCCFFFSSRRRHTRSYGDWSSDVCSSDLRRGRSTERACCNRRRRWRTGGRIWPLRQRIAGCAGATGQERADRRSEERRVGKECRSRWGREQKKKKRVREGVDAVTTGSERE